MARETIILVHGLWMTGLEMSLLRRHFQNQGYAVHRFSYHMVRRSLATNCQLLRDFIARHAGETTHVVAHSLGGVLALHTLRHYPELPVERVVCLGSPLVGSEAGRRILRYKPGRTIIGKTLPEGIFEYPLREWQGTQQVGVIAGTRWGVGFGLVLGHLPRPNDGLIAVAETCLPGIQDHLELPVSHNGMLLSRQTADQSHCFLQHGSFRRASS